MKEEMMSCGKKDMWTVRRRKCQQTSLRGMRKVQQGRCQKRSLQEILVKARKDNTEQVTKQSRHEAEVTNLDEQDKVHCLKYGLP